LSAVEALAYAQRGRGERKRPLSGWESLTPTELDVVRLVKEGLSNAEVATRLFASPRTVQTHLTLAVAVQPVPQVVAYRGPFDVEDRIHHSVAA
jgi:DNA-binding CsgD family transcriptional regulator